MIKFDAVHKPKHYNSHPSGIEAKDVTRNFDFPIGNALKYIWRAGNKGDYWEDMNKALEYLNWAMSDHHPNEAIYCRKPAVVAIHMQEVIKYETDPNKQKLFGSFVDMIGNPEELKILRNNLKEIIKDHESSNLSKD